ncbi:hypothetical protein H0O02_03130, partial [Candidatus Micrarchaeota archaeon]|nr:hypothetical protein [Candidatus Micrarchaeota archaeon]
MEKRIIFLGILMFGFLLFGCTQPEQPPIIPPVQPPQGQPPAQQPECNSDTDCNGGFECAGGECILKLVSREEAIPEDAVKITPETDKIPPELHSDEFEAPVPMSGPINTAGAEDGPFMMPDG